MVYARCGFCVGAGGSFAALKVKCIQIYRYICFRFKTHLIVVERAVSEVASNWMSINFIHSFFCFQFNCVVQNGCVLFLRVLRIYIYLFLLYTICAGKEIIIKTNHPVRRYMKCNLLVDVRMRRSTRTTHLKDFCFCVYAYARDSIDKSWSERKNNRIVFFGKTIFMKIYL